MQSKQRMNSPRESNTDQNRDGALSHLSKYHGVTWTGSSWLASMHRDGQTIKLGTFAAECDAARAFDLCARQYQRNLHVCSETVKLNFPDIEEKENDQNEGVYWSVAEELKLARLVLEFGPGQWSKLQKRHFPHRTEGSLRVRWYSQRERLKSLVAKKDLVPQSQEKQEQKSTTRNVFVAVRNHPDALIDENLEETSSSPPAVQLLQDVRHLFLPRCRIKMFFSDEVWYDGTVLKVLPGDGGDGELLTAGLLNLSSCHPIMYVSPYVLQLQVGRLLIFISTTASSKRTSHCLHPTQPLCSTLN